MRAPSVLVRALQFGGMVTLGIAILGSAIGFLVAGPSGLVSALIGALLAAIFMAVTAASVLIAARVTREQPSSTVYFGIILGSWALKMAAFLAAILAIRSQLWLSPYVFLGAVIAAVLGSLVADIVAVQTTRVSYVGEVDVPRQNGHPSSSNGPNRA